MSRVKLLARKVYLTLPESFRSAVRGSRWGGRLRRRYFETDTKLHDAYYDDAYFKETAWFAEWNSAAIAADCLERFRPADVVDVGAGSGDYLAAFARAGVPGHGVELAESGLRLCREKGLDVRKIDLTTADALPWTADLVYSFEVAEHLPESAAARFVDLLTGAARAHLVLTAAPPGQVGLCHVNCRPKDYWIDLVECRGFRFDAEATEHWERRNRDRNLAEWFAHNLMVFHRRP